MLMAPTHTEPKLASWLPACYALRLSEAGFRDAQAASMQPFHNDRYGIGFFVEDMILFALLLIVSRTEFLQCLFF